MSRKSLQMNLAVPAWVGLYIVLAALPLPLSLIGPIPEPRPLLNELGLALGFVALAMMAVQFALTARVPWLSRRLGQDTLLQFHRQSGILAGIFVLGHPAVMVLADPAYVEFFDPRANLPRAAALSMAMLVVALLIALPIWRRRIGMAYEWWRLSHGALGLLIILIGLAHILQVGHYVSGPVKRPLFVLLLLVPIGLLLHTRLLKPALMRRRPYRVVSVCKEVERVHTVQIEPVGHPGLRFEAGQFAWLTFGDSPFSVQQHPFTMAGSAAAAGRLEFTIKKLGDFTSGIGSIPEGSPVFVEGPAGNFVLGPDAPRAVYIVGGIGITPAISLLRTFRDRDDPRPVTLIYATATLERAAFREELAELAGRINLRVVHVPEDPPEGWTGPSGYVSREVFERVLDAEDLRGAHFRICGPEPMMDAAERALLDLGVPLTRIRSERFNIV